MFEQMGYKHTGLGVLTLEGPIDPDKVSSVSRDAIVAFVECQVTPYHVLCLYFYKVRSNNNAMRSRCRF